MKKIQLFQKRMAMKRMRKTCLIVKRFKNEVKISNHFMKKKFWRKYFVKWRNIYKQQALEHTNLIIAEHQDDYFTKKNIFDSLKKAVALRIKRRNKKESYVNNQRLKFLEKYFKNWLKFIRRKKNMRNKYWILYEKTKKNLLYKMLDIWMTNAVREYQVLIKLIT